MAAIRLHPYFIYSRRGPTPAAWARCFAARACAVSMRQPAWCRDSEARATPGRATSLQQRVRRQYAALTKRKVEHAKAERLAQAAKAQVPGVGPRHKVKNVLVEPHPDPCWRQGYTRSDYAPATRRALGEPALARFVGDLERRTAKDAKAGINEDASGFTSLDARS